MLCPAPNTGLKCKQGLNSVHTRLPHYLAFDVLFRTQVFINSSIGFSLVTVLCFSPETTSEEEL